jgi:hypothetical protein
MYLNGKYYPIWLKWAMWSLGFLFYKGLWCPDKSSPTRHNAINFKYMKKCRRQIVWCTNISSETNSYISFVLIVSAFIPQKYAIIRFFSILFLNILLLQKYKSWYYTPREICKKRKEKYKSTDFEKKKAFLVYCVQYKVAYNWDDLVKIG